MDHLRAIVLADGEPVSGPLPLPDPAFVIAADGGLSLAHTLGLKVDLVVGDMDSVDPEDLAAAEQNGARIERHPTDKEATDLELAFEAAMAAGAGDVTVVGGAGGRIDHLLANALLLTRHRYRSLDLAWLTDTERVTICDPTRPAQIHGSPAERVSLLPIAGTAHGVTTTGLRWALEDDDLIAGSTRGVSNELTAEEASVSVGDGALLVVQERTEP